MEFTLQNPCQNRRLGRGEIQMTFTGGEPNDQIVRKDVIKMNIITKHVAEMWFLWKYVSIRVSQLSDFEITACDQGYQEEN